MSDEKAAAEAPAEEKEKKGAYAAKDVVVIHGRFQPDGTVTQIAECPEGVSPQTWFNYLADKAADAYQTLAGARIVFTLTPERLSGLKADCQAA